MSKPAMPIEPTLTEAPQARPSSTVVLARNAAGPPELLLVRRHAKSTYGGAFAFPGGVLESADAAVAGHCVGLGTGEADRLLGTDGALAYFSAAIRELFEESGVLLADTPATDVDLATARDRLNDGSLAWDAFVAQSDIRLRCDALGYFSFWITPEALPQRYSTRFFLAKMPDDQDASHCGGELIDSCWVTAAEALRSANRESIRMHFPTIKTLESLAQHSSLQALLDWADSCARAGVRCIFPEIDERDGESRVIVEGEDAGALK